MTEDRGQSSSKRAKDVPQHVAILISFCQGAGGRVIKRVIIKIAEFHLARGCGSEGIRVGRGSCRKLNHLWTLVQLRRGRWNSTRQHFHFIDLDVIVNLLDIGRQEKVCASGVLFLREHVQSTRGVDAGFVGWVIALPIARLIAATLTAPECCCTSCVQYVRLVRSTRFNVRVNCRVVQVKVAQAAFGLVPCSCNKTILEPAKILA